MIKVGFSVCVVIGFASGCLLWLCVNIHGPYTGHRLGLRTHLINPVILAGCMGHGPSVRATRPVSRSRV